MILESITQQLAETLENRALAVFGRVVDRVLLQAPPKVSMGDLTTSIALGLAKSLGRNPREVAQQLAAGMQLPALVDSVSVGDEGELHFHLDRGAFTAEHFRNVMLPPLPSGERVLVEHTSISPREPALIGDLRSAILGDTYARCAKWLGDRVETLISIDDADVQTAVVVPRDLQTMLRLGIEYDLLLKESDVLHLHFWDRAFELLKQSGAVIYEKEGLHKGCWVLQLDESKQPGRESDEVLVRSNGAVTESGRGIARQLWKLGLLGRTFEYRKSPFHSTLWETAHDGDGDPTAPKFGGATRVVTVTDSRQVPLQKMIEEGVRQVAGAQAADASIHFSWEAVAAAPFIEADKLLDALERKAAEAVQARLASGDSGDVEPADVTAIGRQVAVAALRYSLLRSGSDEAVAFDLDQALRFEEDSGPYLQDSLVRVENIFREMREGGVDPHIDENAVDDLTLRQGLTDEAWELVKSSAELPSAIRRAVDTLDLSLVTRSLLQLGQKFNTFSRGYPILHEEDVVERQRRAVCAEVFRLTMLRALPLLGIPLPPRM